MKPSTSTLALRPATRLPKGVYVIPTAPASDRWARGATRGPRALSGGVADRRRGAMTVAVTRKELAAGELRREAGRCRDARAARRMLALALVLEGGSREARSEERR